MKTRIISAIIGISLMVFILFFYKTLILNFAISIICCMMMYEMFCATKLKENCFIFFVGSLLYSFLFPFLKTEIFGDLRLIFFCLYFVFSLVCLLKNKDKTNIYNLIFCYFFTVLVANFITNIVYIRTECKPFGLYYIMFIFLISWICDAFAYFFGRKFGKTLLAPKISPKKTVEGAICGFAFSFISIYIFNFLFLKMFPLEVFVNYVSLFFATFFGAIFSIVGDLIMSVLKRKNKIKDFGDLIKGHGGVLDRFDSVLLVTVFLYYYIKLFPILFLKG